MKTIKIILGTYGYMKNGTPPVDLIDKNSEPIEVSDEEAARLIDSGVAVEVKAAVPTSAPAATQEPKGTEEPVTDAPMVTGHLDAEALKGYSYNDLRRLAKDLGLDTTGKTEELIERIASAQVQAPATEDDGTDADNEEPPVLTAVDPE